MMAGLRNKFVNQFKIEVGLYLVASGATWETIDTISSIGYSACAKTVMDYQKKIQLNHITKIENHFSEKVNVIEKKKVYVFKIIFFLFCTREIICISII